LFLALVEAVTTAANAKLEAATTAAQQEVGKVLETILTLALARAVVEPIHLVVTDAVLLSERFCHFLHVVFRLSTGVCRDDEARFVPYWAVGSRTRNGRRTSASKENVSVQTLYQTNPRESIAHDVVAAVGEIHHSAT